MNTMTIPGFTAETSLTRPTEFYRTLTAGGRNQGAQVLPQLPTTLRFETRGCKFQICTLTIDPDQIPPATWACTDPRNICAHPPRDAGALF